MRDADRDERLNALIEPEAAEALYSACVWTVCARRGIPSADNPSPSIRREAYQRLYRAGYLRGRKEERAHMADDGR